jgi:transcription initiation factor TFIID subunit 7
MMPKPHITLKIGGAAFGSQNNSPVVSTPTPGGGPKIKLSLGGMPKPPTPGQPVVKPAAKPVQKTKAGRATKPSAKLIANKNGKRTKEDSDDEDSMAAANRQQPADTGRLAKKLRLSVTTPKTPRTPSIIRTKFKGKPPKRPFGEGYDSEASDREEDPLIEEEFVLRMAPGEDCEYLRRMIEEKKIGIGKKEGGADVQMKFLHPEGRRAVVTIQGRHYAATLVDLPCVIEGMKSWDKKGWYKAADICQMLYVFAQVPNEAAAGTIELPKVVDSSTFQYPHGITPPMHNARKRRFRKRLHRSAIEAVEDAVEKLLDADAHAESTRFEIIEPEGSRLGSRALSTASPGPYRNGGEEYSEDEDAEGEADEGNDYFSHVKDEEEDAPLVGEEEDDEGADENMEALEAALEAEFMEADTPSSNVAAEEPGAVVANGGTPEADGEVEEGSGDESSAGDDDDDDDDDDANGEDEVDEDERARLAQLQGAKEDIAEMEKQLSNLEAQMATQANPILKRRIKDNIEKVKAELQLRKSAIGEADED